MQQAGKKPDMANERVKKLLGGVVSIPSLPNMVKEVLSLLDQKNTSANDLQSIITKDPAISAKVLKLVNSSYYGFPSKIASIHHAVVILGFNTLRSLVLSLSAFDSLSHGMDKSVFDFSAFTIHSNVCAITAKIIAKGVIGLDEEDAFATALLHDIGKVILCRYLPEEFKKVSQKKAETRAPDYVIEREVMGFTHAELGGWLAEKWKLPEKICRGVLHHHDFSSSENDTMTAVVHVADIMCVAKGFVSAQETMIPELEAPAFEHLKLTRKRVVEIMREIDQQLEKAIELFQRM